MGELDYVVLLAGGLSPEREISLRSGEQVRDALSEAGVQAILADADVGLLDRLRSDPPTAVFPVIHGAPGEDGSLREVLGLLGVPTSAHCQAPAGWPSTSRPPRFSPQRRVCALRRR
jgi:D-alanine-D-alanine ligase